MPRFVYAAFYRRVLCFGLCLLPALSWAGTWVTGHISWVSDGDTLWLHPDAGQDLGPIRLNKGRVKLRLEAIDAPESCQAGGATATTALRTKTLGQAVRVELLQRDQYGRWLARLYLPAPHPAPAEDINAWLVAQGQAWDYPFAQSQSGRYAPLQAQARSAKRGLWAQPEPIPPRQFRRQHGSCYPAAASTPTPQPQPLLTGLAAWWSWLQQRWQQESP